ncbi:MAG: class I SAM-dependent methyltransferase, partial [Armatimonadota bacterium]
MSPEEIEKMFRLEDVYWWFVARRRLVSLLLREAVEGGEERRVLDVGCGTGATMRTLAQHGRVWGVDPSTEALSRCRERGFTALTRGTVEALPFGDNSFDVVTCLDVLEHVDDEAALAELCRVCRPCGWLLLTVPAYRFLWSEHDEALQHRRRYGAGEVRAKLEAAGFRVAWLTYVLALLLLPIALFRLGQRLFRRKRAAAQTAHIMLPDWLNRLLVRLLDLESRLVRRVSLPFGVSVVCLARKPPA